MAVSAPVLLVGFLWLAPSAHRARMGALEEIVERHATLESANTDLAEQQTEWETSIEDRNGFLGRGEYAKYGYGSKMRTQNGTLANGKDKDLRSPGGCILTRTHIIICVLRFLARAFSLNGCFGAWPCLVVGALMGLGIFTLGVGSVMFRVWS